MSIQSVLNSSGNIPRQNEVKGQSRESSSLHSSRVSTAESAMRNSPESREIPRSHAILPVNAGDSGTALSKKNDDVLTWSAEFLGKFSEAERKEILSSVSVVPEAGSTSDSNVNVRGSRISTCTALQASEKSASLLEGSESYSECEN